MLASTMGGLFTSIYGIAVNISLRDLRTVGKKDEHLVPSFSGKWKKSKNPCHQQNALNLSENVSSEIPFHHLGMTQH